MEWKIGCSGYYYPEWRGEFYPENLSQRRWFEYYTAHFNTLELNVTYYKFPRTESLRRWYNRSPAGFSFTVKAPRHITHFKKFSDAQRMVGEFNHALIDGLGDKLGCVLFQFPATFQYDPERLSRITGLIDGTMRNVLEFRHPSWWQPSVYEAMKKADIVFSGMSHPSLPDDVVSIGDTVYYRFHGVPHLYNSMYEPEKLEQIAQQIFNSGARQAYLYFNNTAAGHAITNAKQLQDICELVH